MKIINPYFEFVNEPDSEQILNTIERAYRICYLSESKGNRDTFIKTKIKAGHESPLEHASVSVIITTNRGITHEIVRHRVASYCQESSRYCNYSKDKFDKQLTFIRPTWCSEKLVGEISYYNAGLLSIDTDLKDYDINWMFNCLDCEYSYLKMLNNNYSPEQARDILNNSVATKIMVTMNIREWRHFFKLRALGTTGKPHPEMTQITIPMLKEFHKKIPVVFDDLYEKLKGED